MAVGPTGSSSVLSVSLWTPKFYIFCTCDVACKPLNVLFNNIQICFHSFLLVCLSLHGFHVLINCLHYFVVLTRLLIQLDTQVQKDELKDIFLVFRKKMLESLVLNFLLSFLFWRNQAPSKFLVNDLHFFIFERLLEFVINFFIAHLFFFLYLVVVVFDVAVSAFLIIPILLQMLMLDI